MTIRYRRAPAGYRLERVDTPTSAPPPPAQETEAPPEALIADLRQALDLIARCAAGLRAGVHRRQALRLRVPPTPRERGRDVTGGELYLARTQAGLSQRQLAAERGYSRSLVAECERGTRSVPADLGLWARGTLRQAEAEL